MPFLQWPLAERFLPQSVPPFSATQNLQRLREKFLDFSYEEATLNSSSPRSFVECISAKLPDAATRQRFLGESTAASLADRN